jgi:undecaprenyl-diphosphatase
MRHMSKAMRPGYERLRCCNRPLLKSVRPKSRFADYFLDVVCDNQLLTGALMMSKFWWAWFRQDKDKRQDREIIVSGIFLCFLALFLARALALLLPFRERPGINPALHFVIPYGLDVHGFLGWSSFPSDHATLFFALATTIFFISHKLGIAAYLYSFFIVCLPRVYLGAHYPTDILVGAFMGICIACLSLIKPLRSRLAVRPMHWLERSPASFYLCFYLITFAFGTMFNPVRSIAVAASHALRSFLHHAA